MLFYFYSLVLNLTFAVCSFSLFNCECVDTHETIIPFFWETPLYHTEVDRFGYHPYNEFASHIYNEYLIQLVHRCAVEGLECEKNRQGKINSVNIYNLVVNNLTSIKILIDSHSQHFINILLNRQDNFLLTKRELILKDIQLKLDHIGSSLAPIANDDSYITAILILSLPEGFVHGNSLFILDPRTSPVIQNIPHSSYVRYYSIELQIGQLIIIPSYVKWYMLPNVDNENERVYILFQLTLLELSPLYGQYNPFKADCSANYNENPLASIKYLWGTPIWKTFSSMLHSLNENLTNYTLTLEKSFNSVVKSNYGGWQSPANQLSFIETNILLSTLKEEITKTILEYAKIYLNIDAMYAGKERVDIRHSWFGVNRYLNANLPHIHPDSHISGVYYINIGQSKNIDTRLFHIDPRSCSVRSIFRDNGERIIESRVSAGNLILFPSWLEHFVEPCLLEEEPRIVFSFNAILL